MAVGQVGLMWALIFITIALRFSPKRLENFIGFNHKASDLGNDHFTRLLVMDCIQFLEWKYIETISQ
jgi:hypothetical protein